MLSIDVKKITKAQFKQLEVKTTLGGINSTLDFVEEISEPEHTYTETTQNETDFFLKDRRPSVSSGTTARDLVYVCALPLDKAKGVLFSKSKKKWRRKGDRKQTKKYWPKFFQICWKL